MSDTLQQWDFKQKHVQPTDLNRGMDFVSSESIVVCAATINDEDPNAPIGTEDLVPIGILDNVSVIQNKQIQQLFEIGSRIPFFIPGRTYIQANLTRVVFNGGSLLSVLYPGADSLPYEGPDSPGSSYEGATNYWANLASSFFNKSLNLAFIIKDSENEPVGALILRDCFIQNYQMSVTAQQTIVLENVSLRCSRIESLNITTGNTPA